MLAKAEFIIRNPKVAVILLAATVLWAALHGWTDVETLHELVYEWEGLWADLI